MVWPAAAESGLTRGLQGGMRSADRHACRRLLRTLLRQLDQRIEGADLHLNNRRISLKLEVSLRPSDR
jgi:hypothetical protein